MANAIEGAELIELIEIDQDLCAQVYGDNSSSTNLLRQSETYANPKWVLQSCATERTSLSPFDPAAIKSPTKLWKTDGFVGRITQYFTPLAATDYQFSFFAMAGSSDIVELVIFAGTAAAGAKFNLTTGVATALPTVGIIEPPLNYAIVDLGGGLFRLSVGRTSNSADQGYVIAEFANSNYGFSINDSVHLHCAQLEINSIGPTTYIPRIAAGPCDAALSASTPDKCFNTRATCQDTANYTLGEPLTIYVGKPSQNLPKDIQVLPLLDSLDLTPSLLNTTSNVRNSPLGSRAKLSARAFDTQSIDSIFDPYYEERLSGAAQFSGVGYDPDTRGTLWSKWRARNPYYLGRQLRAKQGVVADGKYLSELDTRYYVIESFDGPYADGAVNFVAKDPLKLADNARAQAPAVSKGKIIGPQGDGSMLATDTTFTMDPASAADDYSIFGYGTLGAEIVSFSRAGANFTLGRGLFTTEARTHSQGDAFQQALEFFPQTAAEIVNTLLTNYTDIAPEFLDLASWIIECNQYIPFSYSAIITKPVGVMTLLGELAEVAGFSLWWDAQLAKVRFEAVKQPGVSSVTLTEADDILAGTLKIQDSPESRISQLWIHFGQIDPSKNIKDENNYAVTRVIDDIAASSAVEFGQEEVRKIYSRWIPALGGASAENLGERQLSRFRDIPRKGSMELPANQLDVIKMGDSHRIAPRYLTDAVGNLETMGVRVLAVENKGFKMVVRFEELRFFKDLAGDNTRNIPVETDLLDLYLPDAFTQTYSVPPQASNVVNLIVSSGAVIGASDPSSYALDTGDTSFWPVGITINVIVLDGSYISGAGGKGGNASAPLIPAQAGQDGGVAIKARIAMTLTYNGVVQGGGGGGGGKTGIPGPGAYQTAAQAGGGAGSQQGEFGSGVNKAPGTAATLVAGGIGATSYLSSLDGTDGGGPGLPGEDGSALGGAAGAAIEGIGFVTLDGASTGAVVGATIP